MDCLLVLPQAMWSPWPMGGSEAYEMSLTGTEEQVGAWSGEGLSHQGSLCSPRKKVLEGKSLIYSLNCRALLKIRYYQQTKTAEESQSLCGVEGECSVFWWWIEMPFGLRHR